MAGWPEAEFDEFVGTRSVALVRFAYRLTGDLGHAQDLVQSALLSVYVRSRHRKPDAPEAYARKAILNTFISGRRKRRVSEQLVERVPDQAAQQLNDSPAEQHAAMAELLAGLSTRQRAVLILRYYEDWSEDQIADALGMRPGTVKSLASRALAALRDQAAKSEWSKR